VDVKVEVFINRGIPIETVHIVFLHDKLSQLNERLQQGFFDVDIGLQFLYATRVLGQTHNDAAVDYIAAYGNIFASNRGREYH
jgi:hypothetical protein